MVSDCVGGSSGGRGWGFNEFADTVGSSEFPEDGHYADAGVGVVVGVGVMDGL